MRLLFLVFCLLATAGGAAAQTPTPTVVAPETTVSGITVTNAGTFTAQATSKPAEAGQKSPTGTVGTVTDWHFVSDSTDVDGKIGTQFGIEFRIDGPRANDGVTLHLSLAFPPEGIRNPNTGTVLRDVKVAFPDLKIGSLCVLGYGFDNAWEVVPGEWKMQILYRDRVLAERTFTVRKAE
jgi:hypothetical protein